LNEKEIEHKVSTDTPKNLKEKDKKRNLPVILDNNSKKSTGK